MNETTPGNDPIYKRLYACPEMVADLLLSVLPDAFAMADWRTLRPMPAEHVGENLRGRRGDTAWRVETRRADGRKGRLHALVLLEYQSTTDRAMALRVMEYTAMHYLALVRQGALRKDGRLPPVLAVVLYNGDARWTAAEDVAELIDAPGPALAGFQPSQRYALLDERRAAADDMHDLTRAVLLLEQSRSPQELADAARQAAALLPPSGEQGRQELRRAFSVWLHVLGRRLPSAGEAPPADDDLVETLEEVAMSLADRVATWGEPYLRQGIEQGIEQGVREGQRALLRRLAAARFGDATAERLFARLRQEESPERLAEVGEAIVRCETGEDLLRSAGA